jgi:hypothetical protein
MRTMRKPNREPTAYAEIGGYMYENQGQAKVKMQTSVNKPLKLDDADRVTKINKVRVEMHVTEDKSVQENQVYEKDIRMKQTTDEGQPMHGTAYEQQSDAPIQSASNPAPDDFKTWTKNIIDNILARLDSERLAYWIVIVAVALIAAFALGLAVLR